MELKNSKTLVRGLLPHLMKRKRLNQEGVNDLPETFHPKKEEGGAANMCRR
jgi:hypothetical protein